MTTKVIKMSDLSGRLRDDSALSKERWASCKKIGDERGMSVASQIADDCDEAARTIDRLTGALGWYAEQAAGCRKLGQIGDPYRHALDADGGKRALTALSSGENNNGE